MSFKIDERARLRLDIMDEELRHVCDQRMAARLLIIVAEGIHEGLFSLSHCWINDEGVYLCLSITNTPLTAVLERSFVDPKRP